MQLAASSWRATLPPRLTPRPAGGARASRCSRRPPLIAAAVGGDGQGAPPPPPPPADGEPQQPAPAAEEDKSLQLPPDVIARLRSTVFRCRGLPAGGVLAARLRACSPYLTHPAASSPFQLRHLLRHFGGKLPSGCGSPPQRRCLQACRGTPRRRAAALCHRCRRANSWAHLPPCPQTACCSRETCGATPPPPTPS